MVNNIFGQGFFHPELPGFNLFFITFVFEFNIAGFPAKITGLIHTHRRLSRANADFSLS